MSRFWGRPKLSKTNRHYSYDGDNDIKDKRSPKAKEIDDFNKDKLKDIKYRHNYSKDETDDEE